MSEVELPYVVVRSRTGVFFGRLESATDIPGSEEQRAVLLDCRRAWDWQGATETIGLAVRGPKSGRITEAAPRSVVMAGEIHHCTPEAVEAWSRVAPWRA